MMMMTCKQHQPAREKASQMGMTADWQPWLLASVYECTWKWCKNGVLFCVCVCVCVLLFKEKISIQYFKITQQS